MTRRTILCTVMMSMLVTLPAMAGHHDRRDWAKVVRATPIYETHRVVTPQRECWTERVVYERPRRGHRHPSAPAILGAAIGGVIGHEIAGDRRSDKRFGTVLGAVVGGTLGRAVDRRHDEGGRHQRHYDRHARHRRVDVREQERCEVRERVSFEERLVGYDVDYKYRGRVYRTQTENDPGRHIRVAVAVRPVRP